MKKQKTVLYFVGDATAQEKLKAGGKEKASFLAVTNDKGEAERLLGELPDAVVIHSKEYML